MKKITTLLFAFVIISSSAVAQIYGIKAGVNMSTHEHGLFYYPSSIIFGINLGGTAEFQLGGKYSFETGLTFNNKGARYTSDTVTRLAYLDIPINIKYKFKLKEKPFYLSVGPYIGFGIAGSHLTKVNGEIYSDKVKWGNCDASDDFKRLDYGINFGAESELGAIVVALQYGVGLANTNSVKDLNHPENNRLLSLSVAYKFAKK